MSLRSNQNPGKSTGGGNPSKAPKNIKRVEDIILTSDHPLYNGPHDLGTIFFSDEKADEIPQDPTTLPTAIPLNRNLITYPSINDLVPISKGPSPDYYVDLNGLPTAKVNYYGPSLNVFNSTTNNSLPNNTDDPQLGVYFKENVNLSPLKPGEGDTIIEGKNGQRIRFTTTGPKGSNSISRNVTDDPNDGNPSIGQRAMIISLGSGMSENITADNASIYMFENHSIPLEAASTNVDSTKSTYTPVKDPLDAISEPPPTITPTPSPTPATQEQVVDFSDTLPENQAVEEKVTTPPPKKEDDPFDDPVFNALDEAIDEGLITEEEDEDFEVSGTVHDPRTESPDNDEPDEPFVDPGDLNLDPDATDEYTKFVLNRSNIINNLDPNAEGNKAWRMQNFHYFSDEANYKLRKRKAVNGQYSLNQEATVQWNAGNYDKGIYSNQKGDIYICPPPTRILTMKKSTKRTIKYLCIHCTAGWHYRTPANSCSGFFSRVYKKDNENKYRHDNLHWSNGGYHWMVMDDGLATRMYDDDKMTNGAVDINPRTIHLNWIGGRFGGSTAKSKEGGVDSHTVKQRQYGFGSKDLEGTSYQTSTTCTNAKQNNIISKPQAFTLYRLIKGYINTYPDIKVIGHNQITQKNCPLFHVPTFMKAIGKENNTDYDYPIEDYLPNDPKKRPAHDSHLPIPNNYLEENAKFLAASLS